jgi:hypothetical protein
MAEGPAPGAGLVFCGGYGQPSPLPHPAQLAATCSISQFGNGFTTGTPIECDGGLHLL